MLEGLYSRRGRPHRVQEVALGVMLWPSKIFCILWPCFSGCLSKIIPKPVIFTEVNVGNLPSDCWSGVEFGPFVFRIRIKEWIAHFRNTICTIRHVERGVVLLEMFGQRLRVCGRFGPLGFFRI